MFSQILEKGSLYIANDVLKMIVNMAVSEVEGVEKSNKNVINKIKDGFRDGLDIIDQDDELIVNIDLAIQYGLIVPKVIYEVQRQIKEHLELFTGFRVKEINVSVVQMIIN